MKHDYKKLAQAIAKLPANKRKTLVAKFATANLDKAGLFAAVADDLKAEGIKIGGTTAERLNAMALEIWLKKAV